MLTIPVGKRSFCHRKQKKVKGFGNHKEFLARVAKSLYYVELPLINCTSLPVTELACKIFSEVNKFSLNRLDIEKVAHLSRNACVSPCLLVLAFLYLERLKASNPKYLAQVSPTELFLISLVVGSKFLQDDGEGDNLSNVDWADLTGLSVQEINKAEKQFLDAINWEVFVSKEEFWNRFNLLETIVGFRQGCERGWFTYTELNLLIELFDFSTIVQCFWNVTTACSFSYTASIVALIGSAFLVSHIPGLGLKSKVPAAEVTPKEWTTASPSILVPHHSSSGIQDGNVLPLLESSLETNATEPTFFPFYSDFTPKEKSAPNPTNAYNLDLINRLYFRLSSFSFLHVERFTVVDSTKEKDSLFLVNGFNVWTLSDYIRNYLIKPSPPGVFCCALSF